MKHFRISVPIAPVRLQPTDTSEQVTQFLYGEPVEVIYEKNQWRACRSLIDGYEGFVDEKLLSPDDPDRIWSDDLLREPVSWWETPEGLRLLPAGSRVISSSDPSPKQAKPSEIVAYAMHFLGAPYLWGGKSILGIDCSGFTQLVFAVNGIPIPRDASQQIYSGAPVDFIQLAHEGDLAFFGPEPDRITHVGILIRASEKSQNDGEWNILHASGEVRIDVLDHQGIYRVDRKTYTHDLRAIRRLVNR
ncbi:MAG: NlpC/P60 family protein [Flavobacteriales bacterium]